VTRFYLIRHGHTAAIDHHLAGRAEGTNLTDEGQRQVARMVAAMHGVPLAAVVSSPLERTRQTADPLARDHGLDVTVAPEFNEIDFGGWTGSTFAAIDADPRWRRYNAARSLTPAPGGELMIEVQVRALRALLDLRDRHDGGHVAVVSHGDVIRGLLMYLLGTPIDFVHRLDLAPARITIVDLSDDAPRILLVNGDSVP
jgi:broad specificity phosphatase PhoE